MADLAEVPLVERIALLCGLCAGVERVVHDFFAAESAQGGLVTVNREDFLRPLC